MEKAMLTRSRDQSWQAPATGEPPDGGSRWELVGTSGNRATPRLPLRAPVLRPASVANEQALPAPASKWGCCMGEPTKRKQRNGWYWVQHYFTKQVFMRHQQFFKVTY